MIAQKYALANTIKDLKMSQTNKKTIPIQNDEKDDLNFV